MIQTNWRRTNMKRKLGDLKWAAFVRAARLRVAATRRFLRLRNAATAIGKTARGWLVRRRFHFQAVLRPRAGELTRFVQRRRFVRFRKSVVAVQTVLRTFWNAVVFWQHAAPSSKSRRPLAAELVVGASGGSNARALLQALRAPGRRQERFRTRDARRRRPGARARAG